jgi:hypothetical protein
MQDKVVARLTALSQEYEAGRKMLADLEARQLELQQTLLRIGGAIQVLEELLAADQPASLIGDAPPTPSASPHHSATTATP